MCFSEYRLSWVKRDENEELKTNVLNQMLKQVQHDKKKHVIPNLLRNLEFGNGNKLIAFVFVHRMVILWVLIPVFLVATLAMTIFSVWAGEIQRITVEELKKMIDSKADIVVVDNQPSAEYNKAHIPGAINFPWAIEIEGTGGLPRDKLLILYCGCAHEEDSASVGDQLIENFGYEEIKLLKGGLSQWQKLGYPIERKQ